MDTTTQQTRTVLIERDFPHPPAKIWRTLTEPHLIAEWLMDTDFRSEVGNRFRFTAEWGAVDCEVLEIEPQRLLSYSWGDGDLDTIVTFTLMPVAKGTRLRMEQTGFRSTQPRYYGGAKQGWPRFFDGLEQVLARLD
ncbi:SRPBCC family protein [Martelella radicis]|uniref:Uncharacterized protein YndB with AHSA1/START domain n=1 Tax=Martelella radicis TaxID=1397476 RepID=A0A7W6KN27_9HYPH|nr:SRPBCC domain-containing protein [Martelella radicis]MBB4124349.1 uncharacterized protein YndB with AHSA1/START domain [Martelella radicis]